MKDKMHRRYQRSLNKLISQANKIIEDDDLWRGRFHLRQIDARWYKFEDNSGGIIYATIRAYDKKTHLRKDFYFEYAPYFRTVYYRISFKVLNTFIVDDIDVWSETPNPREDKTDWRDVKVVDNSPRRDKDGFGYWELRPY